MFRRLLALIFGIFFPSIFRRFMWCARAAVNTVKGTATLAAKTAVGVAAAPFYALGAALRPTPGQQAAQGSAQRNARLAEMETQLEQQLASKQAARRMIAGRVPAHVFAIQVARRVAKGQRVDETEYARVMGTPEQVVWIASLTRADAEKLLALPQGAVSDHVHGRRRHPDLPPMDGQRVKQNLAAFERGYRRGREIVEETWPAPRPA